MLFKKPRPDNAQWLQNCVNATQLFDTNFFTSIWTQKVLILIKGANPFGSAATIGFGT
jgi:hypothetical protein